MNFNQVPRVKISLHPNPFLIAAQIMIKAEFGQKPLAEKNLSQLQISNNEVHIRIDNETLWTWHFEAAAAFPLVRK